MTSLQDIVLALEEHGQLELAPGNTPSISGIVDDSRRVTSGSLFCAVEGTVEDGHAYASAAEQAGAAAVLSRRTLDLRIPQVLVRDTRKATSIAAQVWFGRPANGMRLVAVTGTNGKSTTASVLRHLINSRETVGCIGTLGVIDGRGAEIADPFALTTPGPIQLHALLATLRQREVDCVVLEASSHGIAQDRLYGIELAVAVYTNLSHDHLDYHTSLEDYRATKMRLSEYVVSGGSEVVLADVPEWRDLARRPGVRRIRYGRGSGVDVQAEGERFTTEGSQFDLHVGGQCIAARLPLLGEFNVTNALAAVATAWGLGVDPRAIVSRLRTVPQVAGRMERVITGPFTVVRDYAHTPDALARVITALRAITTGRLVVLFGAGGDRDRAKRPLMGRAVADGADVAYLTSDNPRTEDPERILDDIAAGMRGLTPIRITDRREAIRHAVQSLREHDCLVLAGKGHEMYQVIGTERRVFDEPAIVREALEAVRR